MKLTVTKYLNVRVGKPELGAPCYQYLSPGSILEVDGKLYKGDYYDGRNAWYKDEAENYYWVGGVAQETVPSDQVSAPNPINYSTMFKDFGANGLGIRVAVLDQGYYNHYAFKNSVTTIKDFTVSDGNGLDIGGHGTHIAGIIAARYDHPGCPVMGVAPCCELIIAKVIPDVSGDHDINFIVQGIDWAISQKAKVINMSFQIAKNDFDILQPTLQKAANANIIMVAAAGDVASLDGRNVHYPAADFANCISIAEVSETYLQGSTDLNPSINYLSGDANYLSTSIPKNNYFESKNGSSMATAFTTGLVVRALSKLKAAGQDITSTKKTDIVAELNKLKVAKDALNFTDNSTFQIS
jgi:subtilisin family serine protease